MFQDLFEGYVVTRRDIEYNVSQWKREPGKNILLVTGLSGSGKSTLARSIVSKNNAVLIELDDYENVNFNKGSSSEVFRRFIETHPQYKKYMGNYWRDMDRSEFVKMMNEVFDYVVTYLHKKASTLYVVEGLQLYSEINHKKLSKFPMIIKGTSYITSQARRIKRGSNGMSLLKGLIDELKHGGLGPMNRNLKDEKQLQSLKTQMNEGAEKIMFQDLFESSKTDEKDIYFPDKDGKVKAFEELFKNDPIKKAVCYEFSGSHEYNTDTQKKIAAVKSCIKFVNNYTWETVDTKVDQIEPFEKPLNQPKVFAIAKSIEKDEKSKKPLIIVDKIHGFYWQSKGKKILLDGNHRLGALRLLERETTPTYLGTYTGAAEKDVSDFIGTDILKEADIVDGWKVVLECNAEYTQFVNLITEASKSRKSSRIEKISLTPEEREAVNAKYGKVECAFFKDGRSGKYFCTTHRCRSKLYDKPTDIPVSEVRFVSSTS